VACHGCPQGFGCCSIVDVKTSIVQFGGGVLFVGDSIPKISPDEAGDSHPPTFTIEYNNP